MKQILKIVIFNIIIALICVCVYSPGLLGLRPEGGLSIKTTIFIATTAFIAGLFVVINQYLLTPAELLYIDPKVSEKYTLEAVGGMLEQLELGSDLKNSRRLLLDSLDSANDAINATMTSIHSLFEPGSISYNRYAGVIEESKKAMIRDFIIASNCLQMTNTLDLDVGQNGSIRNSDLNKISTLVDSINSLSGKLQVFARQLESDKQETDDKYLLEEITRLGDEAKYYM